MLLETFHRAGPFTTRLIAWPHAGGGAGVYHDLAKALPPSVELIAVRLPGRESRIAEPLPGDLRQVVVEVADALAGLGERPTAVFGHSMGALAAFELCHELVRRGGAGARHLVAAAHQAPRAVVDEDPIHGLADDAFLERLNQLGGLPEAFIRHAELRELLLPSLRADVRLAETHTVAPNATKLAIPVSAYGGIGDPDVARSDLEGWAAVTTGPSNVRMFPGGHFFLREPVSVARWLLTDIAAHGMGI